MKIRGLVAALAGAAFLLVAQPALAARSFTDPAGDPTANAPDVTTVNVSNNAQGDLTFRIETPNLADLAPDTYMFLIFDADRNSATGDGDGADFYLIIDGADRTFGFYRWTGAQFEFFPSTAQVGYTGGATINFNKSVIGDSSSFLFWIQTFRGTDPATRGHDYAPDSGDWQYDLEATQHRLGSMAIVAKPTPPRAGRLFSLVVKWVDVIGENLHATPDKVTCSAKVAGRTLRLVGKCKWRIPANARGKTLSVRVTVVWQGAKKVQTVKFAIF
jgi:hypothetical protein